MAKSTRPSSLPSKELLPTELTISFATSGPIVIDPKQWLILIGGIALVASTAFQLGYFLAVGTEFLSMVTAGDYLYSLGLAIFPTALLSPLFVVLFTSASRSFGEHGDRSWWAPFANKSIFLWLALLPITIWLILTGHEALGTFLRYLLIACVGVCALAYIVQEHAKAGSVSLRAMTFCLIALILFIISIGYSFGRFWAGRPCEFVEKDGTTWSAMYLRSLGNGHLVHDDRSVSYVGEDAIKKIVCSSINFRTNATPID